MRHWVVALLMAMSMFMAFAPGVGAVAEWCEDDPPVTIVTPAGNEVLLHVTNYGEGLQNLPYVKQAQIVGQTARGNGRDELTKVEVMVYIPNDSAGRRFKTKSVISTGEFATGTVLDEVKGTSGQVRKLQFTLKLA